ncbi:hypothetical protein TNCV_214841 [Trichonephila clavipes]|nr:hypothetical protein TNCV_214841 [Trichonephila clavipes]
MEGNVDAASRLMGPTVGSSDCRIHFNPMALFPEALWRSISDTTVPRRLHNAGLCAIRPVVCVSINGRQRRTYLLRASEHVSRNRQR